MGPLSRLFGIVTTLALSGCMAQSAPRLLTAKQAIASGPKAMPVDDCELRLFIEQRSTPGIYSIDNDKLGVAAVTELAGGQVADGVCIKHTDEPLRFPAPIRMAGTGSLSLDRFCAGEQRARGGGLFTCDWNGAFHAARPFTFTLVAAKDHAVAEYVDFVRIHRNGDLMAAWSATGEQAQKSQIGFAGDVLRAKLLSVSQPPNDAALDLRIIPRGGSELERVDLLVRKDEKLFREQVERAALAGFAASHPSQALRDSYKCLTKTVAHVRSQIMAVVRSGVAAPAADPNCNLPLTPAAGTPLSTAYQGAVNKTSQELTALKASAQTQLAALRDDAAAKLPGTANKQLEAMVSALFANESANVQSVLAAELAKDPQPDIVEFLKQQRSSLGLAGPALAQFDDLVEKTKRLIAEVDAQVRLALRAVDEARAFVLELDQHASAIARDPDRQAQIFNAVAQSLAEQGETFEERRANPPLLADEEQLPMSYSDPFQFFLLSPWNGVPLRTGSQTGSDLNQAVAVPFIDVFGGRYQFGKSRFGDLRMAIGIGYTQTENVNPDESVTKNKAAALPNISIGAANLKFGVGLVTSETDELKNKLRWIVGADLFKLISGRNVEAL